MRMAVLAASIFLCAGSVAAGEPEAAETTEGVALDREELIELMSEKTVDCRREKDGSLCWNYLSEEGVAKRLMAEDGERRDGVWFADDQDRFCILWQGKLKPLCFHVYEQDDGSYKLIKNGKHITTLLGMEPGNTKGL